MPLTVVGIDPGTRGGIAVLDDASGRVLLAQGFTPDMTVTEFTALIKSALALGPVKGVYLEKVGHKRGDGSRGSFTFGRAGGVDFLLSALGVKALYVPPIFWQAKLECLTSGNKNISKRRATELFGNQVKVTHNISDALLIAEYGRRQLDLRG